MKLFFAEAGRVRKIVYFLTGILLSCGVFYIDMRYLPNNFIVLLPYVFILMFVTYFVGNRGGVVVLVLTLLLWFAMKTRLYSHMQMSDLGDMIYKVIIVTLLFLLMSYIKHLFRKAQALSFVDELTGLHNRRGFFHLAQYEIEKNARNKKPYSLLYIDINNFKKVNDTKGHKEGDKILKELGVAIKKAIRTFDISARIGGDEFCLFFPNTDRNEIKYITKRIVSNFRRSCVRHLWTTSLSVGVCTAKNGAGLEKVLQRGDDLMYSAKKNGTNRIEYGVL